MLDVICGNKNVTKILIFLFVNGKCYGTQLHRSFKTSLTPIQKALDRLEKGGVITSYYEGKTRLYQFNPSYPLLSELEQLLKKAYTLLAAHEKKQCYLIKEDLAQAAINYNKNHTLLTLWEKLKKVTKLVFHAKTKSKNEQGWNGKGYGEVILTRQGPDILVFHEKGSWQDKQGTEVSFSNTFRWTLDRSKGVISLEHLRHGADRPVFLFYLTPSGKQCLSSVDSHLCEEDSYFGQIYYDSNGLHLCWRVIGPKKNEELDYYYS